MRDYTPKIAKADLVHGEYYAGRCRHAREARWNAHREKFVHWRTKFNHRYLEEICHPEDEQNFDVFVVEHRLDVITEEIPFQD